MSSIELQDLFVSLKLSGMLACYKEDDTSPANESLTRVDWLIK